jgi:hypothetical protein
MMRAVGIFALSTLVGGCSLLFDGRDLAGKSGGSGGGDMATAGGDFGMDDMTGGGGGGGGGDGGGAVCTPRSTVTFTKTTPSVAGSGPYAIAAADIDHDGHLDLITANYLSDNFSVLLGDGAGAFALAASTPVATCKVPQLVLTGDFTGDGLADVVISCFDNSGTASTAAVDVYVNQSTPGMVSFAPVKALALANQSALYYMAAGHFDTLGKLDLALVDPVSNTARILSGNNDGTFAAGGMTFGVGKGGSWTVAGNLNGDAIDDLIVYNETDDTMSMLLSKPTGGYLVSTLAYDAANSSGTLYYLSNPPSLVDVNGDGLLDILVASGTSQTGTVEKFLNSGVASLPAFPSSPMDITTGDFPAAQGLADFNCDGTLDIAVSTNGCDPADVSCPANMSQPPNMWLLPGHGTGYDAALTTGIPQGADSLVIGDFNEDGYPDLAAGAAGSEVTVLINGP